jgi:MEDS: MEthanogen/methylotroph, DcmR Sensory domain
MASERRKTGISVVGDRPWGTHLCLFYETKEDLLEIVLPYFKAGFESGEYCHLGDSRYADAARSPLGAGRNSLRDRAVFG